MIVIVRVIFSVYDGRIVYELERRKESVCGAAAGDASVRASDERREQTGLFL